MSHHTLADQAGIDTSVCEFCEEPLDDERPYQLGLDGCGAHLDCLRFFFEQEGTEVPEGMAE